MCVCVYAAVWFYLVFVKIVSNKCLENYFVYIFMYVFFLYFGFVQIHTIKHKLCV